MQGHSVRKVESHWLVPVLDILTLGALLGPLREAASGVGHILKACFSSAKRQSGPQAPNTSSKDLSDPEPSLSALHSPGLKTRLQRKAKPWLLRVCRNNSQQLMLACFSHGNRTKGSCSSQAFPCLVLHDLPLFLFLRIYQTNFFLHHSRCCV